MSNKREMLFGGAAGGGKSDWSLMCALQYMDVPGHAALILRRTFPQLSQSDGLLPRAQEWLSGTDAHGTDTVGGFATKYLFPNGARLDFGHCQHEKDRFNYQGGAWQTIIFDELTHFTENIYLYIGMSRCRRPRDASPALARVPLRTRSASNPGGVGHEWVRQRFLTEGTESLVNDNPRLFLRSYLKDNPSLDAEEYEKSLNELHPYERKQLLEGDWDVSPPGSLFHRDWVEGCGVPRGTVKRRVRYWDPSATKPSKKNPDPDYTVGALWQERTQTERPYWLEHIERFRAEPGELLRRIKRVADDDGSDVLQVIETQPAAAGKVMEKTIRDALRPHVPKFHRAPGDKVIRGRGFCGDAEAGRVGIIPGDWTTEWFREMEMFSLDDSHSHDDQWDATCGGYHEVAHTGGFTWSDLREDYERRSSQSSSLSSG